MINTETCWYFKMVNMDSHNYYLSNTDLEQSEKVIDINFNNSPYRICIYKGEYKGLLYKIGEEYKDEDVEVPYPVYLTWDGWEEYENVYCMYISDKFKNWLRPQAFIEKSELLAYINIELPKIFKLIAEYFEF